MHTYEWDGIFSLCWRARQVNRSRLNCKINYKIKKLYRSTTQQATESQLATQYKRRTLAPNDPKTSSREKVTLGSSFKQTRIYAKGNCGIPHANQVIYEWDGIHKACQHASEGLQRAFFFQLMRCQGGRRSPASLVWDYDAIPHC